MLSVSLMYSCWSWSRHKATLRKEQLANTARIMKEITRNLEEIRITNRMPKWKDYDASQHLKRRMAAESGYDDIPAPEFGEAREIYRKRLRKAITDRRARTACLDLRRRLMDSGMEHIPLPRDGETPETYRQRIRKVRNILADRRK